MIEIIEMIEIKGYLKVFWVVDYDSNVIIAKFNFWKIQEFFL